jgi:hypothetical protein
VVVVIRAGSVFVGVAERQIVADAARAARPEVARWLVSRR